jgi:hypothetical protein
MAVELDRDNRRVVGIAGSSGLDAFGPESECVRES